MPIGICLRNLHISACLFFKLFRIILFIYYKLVLLIKKNWSLFLIFLT